jgi:hypothetical protein
MNVEVFAEWLARQGHHIIRTESACWHDQGPRLYQAFPYHRLVTPTKAELDGLLSEHKAAGLRFFSPFQASQGSASYHVVYTEKEYNLTSLPKKARYDVRKGLSYMRIEPVSFERLAVDGWLMRYETLQRQHRTRAESQAWWEKLCRTASDLPGLEAWAALENGTMIGSLIAITCDDCVSILYQQSRTAFLPQRVNNTLVYVFTQEVLSRPGNPWIFYGLHSLDAPASVDKFKFRMRYTARPARQRVILHPALALLTNRVSCAAVSRLHRWLPAQPTLSKLEGVLRVYLSGLRPLEQQAWPDALSRCRSELITLHR